jgi:flavodoxin/NAD-dependent dihydropyrimidine dehydrogenase PreA subunit
MKCIIVYFSQSGNTKKMAYAIRSGIQPFVEHCEIGHLDKIDTKELAAYDLIGIGSPCWDGVPFHVERILTNMSPLPGKHTFTFCTHGVMGFRFLPNIVKLLTEKGMIVIGSRDWFCSVNHPLIPKPYLTDGHPDAVDLKEAEEFGRRMIEISRRVSAGENDLIPPIPSMPPPRTLSRPLTSKSIHMEKCLYPECRLCIDNCRLKLIDLSESPPVFPEKCPPCYFCELICPTGAIEADYEPAAKIEIERAKTMFKETLEKVEAEGRFRRLTPVESIGWDTPFFKVYNKHPRYVIPKDDD